jgi:hypothetical protein
MKIFVVRETDPRIGKMSKPAEISAREVNGRIVNKKEGIDYPAKDIDKGAYLNKCIVFSSNEKALLFLKEKELRALIGRVNFSILPLDKIEKILHIIA